MIVLAGVAADKLDAPTIERVRGEVAAELARLAQLPDGDPALLAFDRRVLSRVTDLRRQLAKLLDTPPGFGFRNTNSAWLRGYPEPPPSTLIVVGHSQKYVDRMFTACRVAGHNGNALGVKNEESQDHPDIFVCGPPRLPWPEFWEKYQAFG